MNRFHFSRSTFFGSTPFAFIYAITHNGRNSFFITYILDRHCFHFVIFLILMNWFHFPWFFCQHHLQFYTIIVDKLTSFVGTKILDGHYLHFASTLVFINQLHFLGHCHCLFFPPKMGGKVGNSRPFWTISYFPAHFFHPVLKKKCECYIWEKIRNTIFTENMGNGRVFPPILDDFIFSRPG